MDLAAVPAELLTQLPHCESENETMQLFAQWLARLSGADRAAVELEHDDEAWHQQDMRLPVQVAGEQVATVVLTNPDPALAPGGENGVVQPVLALLAALLVTHRRGARAGALTVIDELTGVLARGAILQHLDERATESVGGPRVGTLYVDLDGFKPVNDTYGHAAGDIVLQTMAERFQDELRSGDRIGRLGGDEFLVVLGAGVDEADLMALAQRLHAASMRPVDVGITEVTVGCSIGASFASSPPQRPFAVTDLLVEADLAMYEAKRSSASVVLADESIGRRAELIAAVDRDLADAIARDELRFHYQPVRSLASGEILAVEGYLRWHHPACGPVPAPLIIERMERLGLVPTFTEWSLDSIGRDLAALRQMAPAFFDKTTSINLTAHQLAWSGFRHCYESVLGHYGFRHVDVAIDVVDAGVVEIGPVATQALAELYERGTIVTLDDFGTSHNVLGYFTQFPVRSIKFDASLVQSLPESARMRSVVRGLSQVAHELGIYTLAEGLECQEQLDVCIELGIVKGQGHHFDRPIPLPDLARLVNDEFPGFVPPAVRPGQ